MFIYDCGIRIKMINIIITYHNICTNTGWSIIFCVFRNENCIFSLWFGCKINCCCLIAMNIKIMCPPKWCNHLKWTMKEHRRGNNLEIKWPVLNFIEFLGPPQGHIIFISPYPFLSIIGIIIDLNMKICTNILKKKWLRNRQKLHHYTKMKKNIKNLKSIAIVRNNKVTVKTFSILC